MELRPGEGLRKASPADVAAIVALVNQAYSVEEFFVRGPRTDAGQVAHDLERGGFLLSEGPEGIEGCVYVEPRGSVGYFGLLAVAPSRQGQGLGRRLVAAAEAHLRDGRCSIVEILVVNWREDLFPFYARLGYAEAGAAPFPESDHERLLRPSHFVVMRKVLA